MNILIAIMALIFLILAIKLVIRVYSLWYLYRDKGILGLIQAFFTESAQSRHSSKKNNKMVKCAKCQLYIIEKEAYSYKGKIYCCHEHAKTDNNEK